MADIKMHRIPIVFSSIFLPKDNQRYGACSLPSKNYKQHGRKNVTNPDMLFTEQQSMMASPN
jgi:hypothetical protein